MGTDSLMPLTLWPTAWSEANRANTGRLWMRLEFKTNRVAGAARSNDMLLYMSSAYDQGCPLR